MWLVPAIGVYTIHSRIDTPLLGRSLPVLAMKLKQVVRILVIFQDRPMFSHIIQEVS